MFSSRSGLVPPLLDSRPYYSARQRVWRALHFKTAECCLMSAAHLRKEEIIIVFEQLVNMEGHSTTGAWINIVGSLRSHRYCTSYTDDAPQLTTYVQLRSSQCQVGNFYPGNRPYFLDNMHRLRTGSTNLCQNIRVGSMFMVMSTPPARCYSKRLSPEGLVEPKILPATMLSASTRINVCLLANRMFGIVYNAGLAAAPRFTIWSSR